MGSSRVDPFAGIVPFLTTADAQSFRVAAKKLGVTASSISKSIAKLEGDLGVRLLNRTSRSVSLTAEGDAFLQRCQKAVGQLLEAREEASQSQRGPRGLLRVSLPPTLARLVVLPALPALLERHPELQVAAVLTDRFVRFAEENVDVSIRIGKITDTSVVARKVRTLRWTTVAAPSYLARRGTPAAVDDLGAHNCLAYVLPNGQTRGWEFLAGSETIAFTPHGNLVADDGQALVDAAVAGLGVVQAHDFMVAAHLRRGELVPVLPELAAPGPVVTLLCAPGRNRSPKVQAFVQFAVAALA